MATLIRVQIKCDWCGAVTKEYRSEVTARDAIWAAGWRKRKRSNHSMGDMCDMCLASGRDCENTK